MDDTRQILRQLVEQMEAPPAIVQHAAIDRQVQELVAATLVGEAGGEGANGMQAVLNVIDNRAKHSATNYQAVVLKPKQFSLWNNLPTDKGIAKFKQHPLWPLAMKLVNDAANKRLPDITGGATHYFNPKLANPGWAATMTKTVSVGQHDFYKAVTPAISGVKR